MNNSASLSVWQDPSSKAKSHPDSSPNAFLCNLYGRLETAASNNWQDTAPVNKADIQRLLSIYSNAQYALDDVADRVNRFASEQLQQDWYEYDHIEHAERQQIAENLVTDLHRFAFTNEPDVSAASWLAFYLCPQLPVFPVSTEHNCQPDSYTDYYQRTKAAFALALPSLEQKQPEPYYGNLQQQHMIAELLKANNWWQRLLFMQQ